MLVTLVLEPKTYKYQLFFFNNRVYKGKVENKYFPTQMVLVDYFTKPLKGTLFKIFRYAKMSYKSI